MVCAKYSLFKALDPLGLVGLHGSIIGALKPKRSTRFKTYATEQPR